MNHSQTVAVSIAAHPQALYAFVRDPLNLPRWAAGLGGAVRQTGAGWTVETPVGPAGLRFAEPNAFGVLDHVVTLPSGQEVSVPLRVVPNGDGCEVLFTVFRLPETTDEAFAADLAVVERDLATLKGLLENEADLSRGAGDLAVTAYASRSRGAISQVALTPGNCRLTVTPG